MLNVEFPAEELGIVKLLESYVTLGDISSFILIRVYRMVNVFSYRSCSNFLIIWDSYKSDAVFMTVLRLGIISHLTVFKSLNCFMIKLREGEMLEAVVLKGEVKSWYIIIKVEALPSNFNCVLAEYSMVRKFLF